MQMLCYIMFPLLKIVVNRNQTLHNILRNKYSININCYYSALIHFEINITILNFDLNALNKNEFSPVH